MNNKTIKIKKKKIEFFRFCLRARQGGGERVGERGRGEK
jgi:uncharacterized short protein YbdD (DUF466 family)